MEGNYHFALFNTNITLYPQEQAATPAPEPSSVQAEPTAVAAAAAAPEKPASEAVDETWEEKEDKQNPKPVAPKSEPAEQKYQYKEGGV